MTTDLHDLGIEPLLQSILDTVSDGVTVIDRDFRVIWHNESIRKMFGQISGRHCYEAYRGRSEPCAYCVIGEVLKDGQQRRVLVDTRRSNGEVAWMECSSGPLRDSKGNIVGAVEIVRNVTDQMRLSEECATLRREVKRQVNLGGIVTQSKAMKTLFRVVSRVAPTKSTILITGESGTGKELFAKALWQNSDRSDKPFIPVNCSAISENLLESELFGHVRGAFTGATSNRRGIIETAQGGTLFLDEIAEIPLALQPKLLRFLQEGECRPVGSEKTHTVDVRVIAATNCDLEQAVEERIFREDLYYRLNVIPIYLPLLRERREDIPMLATHFLQRLCDEHKREVCGLSSQALKAILEYSWPGNVRELENAIEFALHLTDNGALIEIDQLPKNVTGNNKQEVSGPSRLVSIDEYAKQAVVILGNRLKEEEIAELLGISRKTLWEKRKRWQMPRAKT